MEKEFSDTNLRWEKLSQHFNCMFQSSLSPWWWLKHSTRMSAKFFWS